MFEFKDASGHKLEVGDYILFIRNYGPFDVILEYGVMAHITSNEGGDAQYVHPVTRECMTEYFIKSYQVFKITYDQAPPNQRRRDLLNLRRNIKWEHRAMLEKMS
jgi:hypothetical protein